MMRPSRPEFGLKERRNLTSYYGSVVPYKNVSFGGDGDGNKLPWHLS